MFLNIDKQKLEGHNYKVYLYSLYIFIFSYDLLKNLIKMIKYNLNDISPIDISYLVITSKVQLLSNLKFLS